jgi:hypothetical protein
MKNKEDNQKKLPAWKILHCNAGELVTRGGILAQANGRRRS